MDITIKNIGYNKGSSGWVRAEIESGRMFFCEGVTKSEKHALYLEHVGEEAERKRSMCLAIYNPYDLDNGTAGRDDWEQYEVLDFDASPDDPRGAVNIYGLTPAAARAVIEVAKKWCAVKNRNRQEDKKLTIIVNFN